MSAIKNILAYLHKTPNYTQLINEKLPFNENKEVNFFTQTEKCLKENVCVCATKNIKKHIFYIFSRNFIHD